MTGRVVVLCTIGSAKDAERIALDTCLPGLMDMHVHLQGQLGPDNDRDALKMSSQLMQMRSLHYAMNTLLAGFTTIGGDGDRLRPHSRRPALGRSLE